MVIWGFKGHLTGLSDWSGILTTLILAPLQLGVYRFDVLSRVSIFLLRAQSYFVTLRPYVRMQENFYLKIHSGEGGCQALLIEKAFHDDPYFQLKYALTVLDLTPLPLQSDSHLAGVNQACD